MIAGIRPVVFLVLPAAVVETSHWWASGKRRDRAPSPQPGMGADTEAIIVLGYSSRWGLATRALQRWRCQIAVRSQDPERASLLIVTGAGDGRPNSEAAAMATYARDVLGVPSERIVLEEKAISTWENMKLSLPLAERCTAIKIASDPLHARRAGRYVAAMRPDLACRLEPASYRPFEHPVLKAGTLFYELYLAARRRLCRTHADASAAPPTTTTGPWRRSWAASKSAAHPDSRRMSSRWCRL